MSKVEVNQISSQCGSTLTIGQSGDTVTLAAGATQTGFGRTGTVDWDTTAKTASFTAVSGNGYFVNTTSGAITVTLPATPSAGDIVSIADYTNTFQTNNVTVAPNGSPIGGVTENATLSTEGQSVTFIYVDGTEGWKNVQDSTSNVTGAVFITATGGTITTCGDYKIHTFTSPGTFCVSQLATNPTNNNVDYLVVAGGAAGGHNNGGFNAGGGGGAGGMRFSATTYCSPSPLKAPAGLPVTATGFPITVGGGGAGASIGCAQGNSGSNSVFSTITSTGGGGGGTGCTSGFEPGASGGSGGGGLGRAPASAPGGAGNTPPVSPSQGSSGGTGGAHPKRQGGGGGGFTATGTSSTPDGSIPGNGGAGLGISITGSCVARAGGGGGAAGPQCSNGTAGTGGIGGGGAGANNNQPIGGGNGVDATSGTTNTGGGGGGSNAGGSAGSGGSGIVIIRYRFQ